MTIDFNFLSFYYRVFFGQTFIKKIIFNCVYSTL